MACRPDGDSCLKAVGHAAIKKRPDRPFRPDGGSHWTLLRFTTAALARTYGTMEEA